MLLGVSSRTADSLVKKLPQFSRAPYESQRKRHSGRSRSSLWENWRRRLSETKWQSNVTPREIVLDAAGKPENNFVPLRLLVRRLCSVCRQARRRRNSSPGSRTDEYFSLGFMGRRRLVSGCEDTGSDEGRASKGCRLPLMGEEEALQVIWGDCAAQLSYFLHR